MLKKLTRIFFIFVTACSPQTSEDSSLSSLFEVRSGLENDQILQRNESGFGTFEVEGTASLNGLVQMRVISPSNESSWQSFAEVKNGTWRGSFSKLVTGDDFRIEFGIFGEDLRYPLSKVEFNHVAVGDLWVLAGQSNMVGDGLLINAEEPLSNIRSYSMAGRWEIAREPLHWGLESPDPIRWYQYTDPAVREKVNEELRRSRVLGAGLGLKFAKEVFAATKIPIGLVQCAEGGSTIDKWDPVSKMAGGNSLYGSTLRRIKAVGGKVKGVLWYQGESDALTPFRVVAYEKAFRGLIAAWRSDIGPATLPFYFVQLGAYIPEPGTGFDPNGWTSVREIQRKIATDTENTLAVPAFDQPLQDKKIHVTTDGLKIIGKRLARQVVRTLYDVKGVQAVPGFQSAKYDQTQNMIRVQFASVTERFNQVTAVQGFEVSQNQSDIIERVVLDETGKDILIYLKNKIGHGVEVCYACGFSPKVNLYDAAEQTPLSFGPLSITN